MANGLLICNDGRVITVGTGVLWHGGPLTQPIDQLHLALAGSLDEGLTGAVAVPVGEVRSSPFVRYLAGLQGVGRSDVVVAPLAGEGWDAEQLLSLASLYDLAVDVSLLDVAAPHALTWSSQVVGRGPDGLAAAPGAAVAARVLPRAQAAMRDALTAALDLAASEVPASWSRLAGWLEQVAALKEAMQVPWQPADDPVASYTSVASYTLGAYIAAFGLPDGLDAGTLARELSPVPAERLGRLLGGPATGERLDGGALVDRLSTMDRAAAVVWYRPAGVGVTDWQSFLLVAEGGVVRRVAPQFDGHGTPVVDPAAADWLTDLLHDSTTKVAIVDPAAASGVPPFAAFANRLAPRFAETFREPGDAAFTAREQLVNDLVGFLARTKPIGVPTPLFRLTALPAGVSGLVRRDLWEGRIDETLTDWRTIVSRVAHEWVHVGQYALAARYLAGTASGVDALAEAFPTLHVALLDAALANPLTQADPQYEDGRRWADLLVGPGGQEHVERAAQELLTAEAALAGANHALAHATDADRPALQRARDALHDAAQDTRVAYLDRPWEPPASAAEDELVPHLAGGPGPTVHSGASSGEPAALQGSGALFAPTVPPAPMTAPPAGMFTPRDLADGLRQAQRLVDEQYIPDVLRRMDELTTAEATATAATHEVNTGELLLGRMATELNTTQGNLQQLIDDHPALTEQVDDLNTERDAILEAERRVDEAEQVVTQREQELADLGLRPAQQLRATIAAQQARRNTIRPAFDAIQGTDTDDTDALRLVVGGPVVAAAAEAVAHTVPDVATVTDVPLRTWISELMQAMATIGRQLDDSLQKLSGELAKVRDGEKAVRDARAAVTPHATALAKLGGTDRRHNVESDLVVAEADVQKSRNDQKAARDRIDSLTNGIGAARARLRDLRTAEQLATDDVRRVRDELRDSQGIRNNGQAEVAMWQGAVNANPDPTDFVGGFAMLGFGTEGEIPELTQQAVESMAVAAATNYWDTLEDGPDAAERAAMVEKIKWDVTRHALKTDLKVIKSHHGRVSLVRPSELDDEKGGQLNIWVDFEQIDDTGMNPSRPELEGTQGEIRVFHDTVVPASHTYANFRDLLNIPVRFVEGLGQLTGLAQHLRIITPGLQLTLTHNQFRRTGSAIHGRSTGWIGRLREPLFARQYRAVWRVLFGPITNIAPTPAPLPALVPSAATPHLVPTTAWADMMPLFFPKHIAMPNPPDPATVRWPTAQQWKHQPLALDGLHDPTAVYWAQLANFTAAGITLNVDSKRQLLRFVGHDVVSGSGHATKGGLFSEPLYDGDNKPLGVLQLVAAIEPTPGQRVFTQTEDNSLEFVSIARAGETVSAGINNAWLWVLSLGLTFVGPPLADTPEQGPFSTHAIVGTVRGGSATLHMHTAGSVATAGRGFKSAGDPQRNNKPISGNVADVNIRITFNLLVAGEETPRTGRTWQFLGQATGRPDTSTGVRVRWLPIDFVPAAQAGFTVHPPAAVEEGDAVGLAVIDKFTLLPDPGHQPLYTLLAQQLKRLGVLSSGVAGTPEQTQNHLTLLRTTRDDYHQDVAEHLRAGAVGIPFEIPTALGGIDRYTVLFHTTADTAHPTTYEGYTENLGAMITSDTSSEMDASRAYTDTRNIRGEYDPLAAGRTWPMSWSFALGPGQYSSNDVERINSGINIERSALIFSQMDEQLHMFLQSVRMHAAIYGPSSDTPIWDSATVLPAGQRATQEVWVPDFRVLDQPDTPLPAIGAPRDVQAADWTELNRTGRAVPHLPSIAGVRGSKALNDLFRGLLTAMYGEATAWYWFSSVTGQSPAAHSSLSAQSRRAYISPTRLRAVLDQLFFGVHASEVEFESGALSDPEALLKLQAFTTGAPIYQPHHGNRPSDLYYENGVVVSGSSRITNVHTTILEGDGSFGPALTAGDWSIIVSLGGRFNVRTDTNKAIAFGGSDYRVSANAGPAWTVRTSLTFIASIEAGRRNLATNVGEYLPFVNVGRAAAKALDVPQAIESHLGLTDLAHYFEVEKRRRPGVPDAQIIQNLPAALLTNVQTLVNQLVEDRVQNANHAGPLTDPQSAVFLPRRLAARWGPGDAGIKDVHQMDQGRALLHLAVEKVNALVPGIFKPGSTSYAQGFYSRLATMTSPIGQRAAAPGYFSTGEETGPVRLMRVMQVTTAGVGAVVVEAWLVARPVAGFRTTDDLRQVFGRRSNPEALLEMHASTRETRVEGRTVTTTTALPSVNLAATAGGVPSESVRNAGSSVTFEPSRVKESGIEHMERQEERRTAKSAVPSPMATVEIPLQFSVETRRTPLAEWIGNYLGGAAAGLSADWLHGRPADNLTDWKDATVILEFLAGDGSSVPVALNPPAQYKSPTLFDRDPGTGATGRAFDTLPGFTNAEIAAWERYESMPNQYTLSFSRADQVMPQLIEMLLPTVAKSPFGNHDIILHSNGLFGPANTYEQLKEGGIARETTTRTLANMLTHSARLEIMVRRASPWRRATDQLSNATAPTPVGSDPTVSEYFRIQTGGTTHTSNLTQRFMISAVASQSFWQTSSTNVIDGSHGQLRNFVEKEEYGAAPGNVRTVVVSYFTLQLTGGEMAGRGSGTTNSSRRAMRLTPVTDAADATRVSNPNVLFQRDVLIEATGIDTPSVLGSTGLASKPTRTTRWVAATIETRAPETEIMAQSDPLPAGMLLASTSDTPQQHAAAHLPPVDGRYVMVFARSANTPAGLRAAGRTVREIHQALQVGGYPDTRAVVLVVPVGGESLAQELSRLRPTGTVIANNLTRDATGQPSGWTQWRAGVLDTTLPVNLSDALDTFIANQPLNRAPVNPVVDLAADAFTTPDALGLAEDAAQGQHLQGNAPQLRQRNPYTDFGDRPRVPAGTSPLAPTAPPPVPGNARAAIALLPAADSALPAAARAMIGRVDLMYHAVRDFLTDQDDLQVAGARDAWVTFTTAAHRVARMVQGLTARPAPADLARLRTEIENMIVEYHATAARAGEVLAESVTGGASPMYATADFVAGPGVPDLGGTELTVAGLRDLVQDVRAAVPTGTGEAYCVQVTAEIRDRLLGPTAVFRGSRGLGRASDDSALRSGPWSGWDTPRNWPRVAHWDDVHALVEDEVGSTAFVLMGRPGAIGHAFAVVNTPGGVLWVDPAEPNRARRVRTHEQATRLFLGTAEAGAELRVRAFDADRVQIEVPASRPESQDAGRVGLDATDDLYDGSGAEEEEYLILEFDDAVAADTMRDRVLAYAYNGALELKTESIDFYRGVQDGKYYRTQADAAMAGQTPRKTTVVILERTVGVLRSHPHEVGRAAATPLWDLLGRLGDASARISDKPGTAPRMHLTDLLTNFPELDFTELGRAARVGPRPVGAPAGTHWHHSHGVVYGGLRTFLERASRSVWRSQSRIHLQDALTFGDEFAARFQHRMAASPNRPSEATMQKLTRTLSGYAALMYDNAAGMMHARASRNALKYHTAALSRDDFFDLVTDLPLPLQRYLTGHLGDFERLFQETFLRRLPTFADDVRGVWGDGLTVPADLATMNVTPATGETITLREYLGSGLDATWTGRKVSQSDVFGAMTVLDGPDSNAGALLVPKVVIEVRNDRARFITHQQARADHQRMADLSADLYDEALRLEPAERQALGTAWLADGGADPRSGLHWVDPLDTAAPEWADALGAAAGALNRPVTVVQATTGNYFYSHDLDVLEQYLAENPGVARNGLIVSAGTPRVGDQLHAVRRHFQASVIYPLPVEVASDDDEDHRNVITGARLTPTRTDGLHAQGGWRLVTFDNRVFDVGAELDATALRQAFDTVTGAAIQATDADATPTLPLPAVTRVATSPSVVPAPVQPLSMEGLRRVAADVHRSLGAGTGDAYCVSVAAAVRDRLFGFTVSYLGGAQPGYAFDDLLADPGPYAGWGRPSAWPVLAGRDELVDALPDEVGGAAFVLVGRPGAIGHAYSVVHGPDGLIWIDSTQPDEALRVRTHAQMMASRDLLGQVELRMRRFGADGTMLATPAPAPESEHPVTPMLDQAARVYEGSGAEEEDPTLVFVDPDDDISLYRGGVLAASRDLPLQITLETARYFAGSDGGYYRTQADAEAAGAAGEGARPVLLGLQERVVGVLATHWHEVGRPQPAESFAMLRRMAAQSARVPTDVGNYETRLSELYEGFDLEYTDLGGVVTVGPRPQGIPAGSHWHLSFGFVFHNLLDVVRKVERQVWREESGVHLTDGLAFGQAVASRFASATLANRPRPRRDAPLDLDLDQLPPELRDQARTVAAYAAILYANAAGALHALAGADKMKYYTSLLSRIDFDVVRSGLPQNLRDYLDADADTVERLFEQTFRARAGDSDERSGAGPATLPVGLGRMPVSSDGATLHDYLSTGLRATYARKVGQRAVFGGMTTLRSMDLNGGALLLPHWVLEIRSDTADFLGVDEAERIHGEYTALSAATYEQGMRTTGAVRRAAGTGWLAAARNPGQGGLSWIGDPGRDTVPQWAHDFGDRAARRGRNLLTLASTSEPGEPTVFAGQHIRDLAEVTRADPAAASTTLLVAAGGADEAVHAVRRHNRMSMVYPLPVQRPQEDTALPRVTASHLTEAPEGLRSEGGWRLVTFDNRVTDLGPVLTPDLVDEVFTRLDAAAQEARTAPDELADLPQVQVYRAETPVRLPSTMGAAVREVPATAAGLDAMLGGLVGQLDKVGAELAQQLSTSEDLRGLWDGFVSQLRSLERGKVSNRAPDVARLEVESLLSTYDFLLSRVGTTGLTSTVELVRAATTAPPAEVRVFGDWSSRSAQRVLTEVTELAQTLGRPVVAVDLGSRKPLPVVAEAEHAVRVLGWMGQPPLVVTTPGTNVATAAFRESVGALKPLTAEWTTADGESVVRLDGPDVTPALERNLAAVFATVRGLGVSSTGQALPPVLARWLDTRDWPAAESYLREHLTELRAPGIADALADVVALTPQDPRLAVFETALEVAARQPEYNTAHLTPVATGILDTEPRFTGDLPPTFVFDFVDTGGTRADHLPMDGLLFQVMTAGALAHAQTRALLRAAARNALDKANAAVFDVMMEVLDLPESALAGEVRNNPTLQALKQKIIECVDPTDRGVWVGRLDDLSDRVRERGGTTRATWIQILNDVLANCN